ncbi:DUF4198 domain-containing protein [Neorhodopirellula lusitana]|uniref:DUF4198 domain-containing protein n=1 Tax=Neorhodopirellula lusitana TaxID=445327 RepID=UPI00385077FC
MSRLLIPALLVALLIPSTTHAHKLWVRPSQTVLSGSEPWVTFDAAVSNDLFYFNHVPLRLNGLTITAPDGTSVEGENQATGKYRSVFDLPLTQQGTYRVAIINEGVFASWEEDGQRRRMRGTAESLKADIPSSATNVNITESIGRVETFVTNGAPTTDSLKVTGKGIELVPVTHPNDLYAGEKATFRMLVNGEPAPGLEIELVRGETRYRNSLDETTLTTNANGEFEYTFTEPGMYWLDTSSTDKQTSIPNATSRRMGYAATLEVLPQ